ncbi:Spore coat polysaccharide biosynthesis protein F [Paramagnetospirillum magnetotacticum MS-1]|uniref:Spore coat polysaccharide biosynthesis protein F n=1 Tax=Paramagnetospirillum magnetotacticum MS-1 TaxID=272627 RepID=A0A0C2U6V3_PARME|nr:glycosyltransferase family protein [Paramagnetospirillum magnetotacticum]KIL97192.1 Spore coat polysaccharide biosynthesis protein F [Paramagnetospirillum magnetotacticum MS-1]
MKIIATIEARMTSSRLPGKVLLPAQGKPMLARMVERLKLVPSLDGIVVATTVNATDDPIEALAAELGIGCWRGSEDDVLARVLDAAHAFEADVIVELTGDCPLIDPKIVEHCIRTYREAQADYLSNVLERSFPIGMDTQVFATKILDDAARRTDDPTDHEHVSLYIYRHPELYSLKNVAAPPELHDPDLRLTLDTPQDYQLIDQVFAALLPQGADFSLGDILALLKARPQLRKINDHVAHRWV